MPVDPSALVNEILDGLAKIPPGLFAAILLGGPTAIWLALRFSNPPDDAPRPPEPAREEFLWVCISCRSLNQELRDSCYRCHRSRTDESEPGVPDLDRAPAPASGAGIAPGIGIAVGPGRVTEPRIAGSWLGVEQRVARQSLDRVAVRQKRVDIHVAVDVGACCDAPIQRPWVRCRGRRWERDEQRKCSKRHRDTRASRTHPPHQGPDHPPRRRIN